MTEDSLWADIVFSYEVRQRKLRHALGLTHLVAPRPFGLVMDHLEGPSVHEWIRDSPSKAARRHFLECLKKAIKELHEEGIFHNDLATDGNIRLSHNFEPILLDWGKAKSVQEGGDSKCDFASLKQIGFICGFDSQNQAASTEMNFDEAQYDEDRTIPSLCCLLQKIPVFPFCFCVRYHHKIETSDLVKSDAELLTCLCVRKIREIFAEAAFAGSSASSEREELSLSFLREKTAKTKDEMKTHRKHKKKTEAEHEKTNFLYLCCV
jgi:serine/threonine protein kinase